MEFSTLEWQMMDKLRRMANLMEQNISPFCASTGLTPLQLNILLTLRHSGPLTVSGLARHTCMARGNNSALCKKLEKEGFVLRLRDAEDERHVFVSLTVSAEETLDEFENHCLAQHNTTNRRYSSEDVEELFLNLDKMIQILEESVGGTNNE